MSKKLELLLDTFIIDPDVQLGNLYGQERNIFNILEAKETSNSRFLAWLFNPLEGHGLGDYFVKEFFRTVFSEYDLLGSDYKEKILSGNAFFKDHHMYDFEGLNFSSLEVQTEFPVDGGKVDICLIDHANSLVVFIENKFQSALSGDDQLSKYYDWLQDNYKDYYGICVFLDYQGKFDSSDRAYENWIGLDYEWIETFCSRLLDRDVLPVQIDALIRDYYVFLSGEEFDGTWLDGVDDIFPILASRYHELFCELNDFRIRVGANGVKIDELTSKDLLDAIDADTIVQEHIAIVKVYWKYQVLIDMLRGYSRYEHSFEELKERLPGKQLEFDAKKRNIYMFDELWSKFQNDREGDEWCMYLSLDVSGDEDTTSLKVYISPLFIKEEYQETILGLANELGYQGNGIGTRRVVAFEEVLDKEKWINSVVSIIKKVDRLLG